MERFTIERLGPSGWTTWAIGDGLPALTCGGDCGDQSRVVITPDGSVWVNVDQGGLLRFDGTEWEVVRPLGGDVDRPVVGLVANREGVLWAAAAVGPVDVLRSHVWFSDYTLARFDGESWTVPSDESQSMTDRGFPDAVGPEGDLWLGAMRAAGSTTSPVRVSSGSTAGRGRRTWTANASGKWSRPGRFGGMGRDVRRWR